MLLMFRTKTTLYTSYFLFKLTCRYHQRSAVFIESDEHRMNRRLLHEKMSIVERGTTGGQV